MHNFIATTEQLRQLLPTAADVKLEYFQTYFRRAEFQLLRPWLGQAVLDELHAAGDAPEDGDVATLLQLLRQALATYGHRLAAGGGSLVLTGNGPRRMSTDNQKPVTGRELADYLAELDRQAYAELDEVLVFLEEHPATFPTWHSSNFSTIWTGHFFATADQLGRYTTGDVSRIMFRNLQPKLRQAELRYIRPLLGPDLLERLLQEQDLVEHSELVDLVRQAVAGLVQPDDEVATTAAHVALDEIGYSLNKPDSLLQYPEFIDSPAYQPGPYSSNPDHNFYAAF
jgi:hypothetical protein